MPYTTKKTKIILLIGGVIGLLYILLITLSSSSNNTTAPGLFKVTEETVSRPQAGVGPESQQADTTGSSTAPMQPGSTPTTSADANFYYTYNDQPTDEARRKAFLDQLTLSEQEVNNKYGVLEIVYTTEEGFLPRKATGYSGQLVRWTNLSDQPLRLYQTTPKFTEWEGADKIIVPGGTLQFKLYDYRLWTYKDRETNSFGSIYIQPPYAY